MEKKTAAKKTTAKKTTAAPKKRKVAHTETTLEASATKAPKKAKRVRKAKEAKPCKVGGCKRTYRAKGYCVAHYRQWRHGKFAKKRYTKCHDYGCLKQMAANRHGLCEDHFQSFYVKGLEPTHAPVAAPAPKKEEKATETAA